MSSFNGLDVPAYDSGAAIGAPSNVGHLTCRQTAQVLHSAVAAFSDIPGMAFPVYAGRRYMFKFLCTFRTAATTTGIGFACSAPALVAGNWIGLITTGGTGTAMLHQQANTTLGTVLSLGVAAANTDYIAILEGFFEPSADGVLQLRCRTEVDGSQVTVQNTGAGYLIECR